MTDYTGVKVITVKKDIIDELYKNKKIEIWDKRYEWNENLYIVVKDESGGSSSALVRHNNGQLHLLQENVSISGIKPRNKEQHMAFDALMDKNIEVVALTGRAGVGKSLLAMAACLAQLDNKTYDKLVISKNMVQVDDKLGFLPGSLDEKFLPFNQGVLSNMEFLLKGDKSRVQDLIDQYKIEFLPLSVIRGSSWNNSIVICDECFPYNQSVLTENGPKKIGHLHKLCSVFTRSKTKLPKVLSYNEKLDLFEYKKIIASKETGLKEVIQINTGLRKIKCSFDHPFLTTKGWVKARELQVNDLLSTTNPANVRSQYTNLSKDQIHVIVGSYLGDGGVQKISNCVYRIGCTHGIKQEEYVQWKASLLDGSVKYIEKNGYSEKPGICWKTTAFSFGEDFPVGKKRHLPDWIFKYLDEKTLAVWFMDDGSMNKQMNSARISTDSFDLESINKLINHLMKMGITCKAIKSKHPNTYQICINVKGCKKLISFISKYVHPSMAYKVGFSKDVGKYEWKKSLITSGVTPVTSITKTKQHTKMYDLQIEDNHNFIITSHSPRNTEAGIIVHNCQNMNSHETLTLGTRVSENSKLILLGDLKQIDGKLKRKESGLYRFINHEKVINSSFVSSLELIKSERGRVAELFADIFEDE